MARKFTPRGSQPEPEGRVRRSQLVTTYGPGAMVDLLDHAVLVGGLDFWHPQPPGHVVHEPRLAQRLRYKLRDQETIKLDDAAPFRAPPDGKDDEPQPGCGIEVLEFPRWFVCQGCRQLIPTNHIPKRTSDGRYLHDCRSDKKECVPVRFVAACSRGHLQEFPWVRFVHQGPPCDAPVLHLHEGATGDFSEVEVECQCRARRKLIEAKTRVVQAGEDDKPEPALRCNGERPWLGRDTQEDCEESLRLLVRTASNSYFSLVMSALSIPEPGKALRDLVDKHWIMMQAASAATLGAFRNIPVINEDFAGYSDAQILDAVEARKRGGGDEAGPGLRSAEFQTFIEAPPDAPGQEPDADDAFYVRTLSAPPPDGIARVVLAKKLREVRVQVGFTRLDAATPDLEGEFELELGVAPLGLYTKWLPAVEIWGEGLFVQLDESRVVEWESRPSVQARARELEEAYAQAMADSPHRREFPGARLYMLHSLSHLLVTALSLECGYSASAIRERLYCARPDPESGRAGMAAMLFSTGTPGTEGTLGGLVEQGYGLARHLESALRLGALCSNDPVCGAHSPLGDLAEPHLEGAACHGCLYVAECSCEWFNRFLDRALVVPVMGQDPSLAFFERGPS